MRLKKEFATLIYIYTHSCIEQKLDSHKILFFSNSKAKAYVSLKMIKLPHNLITTWCSRFLNNYGYVFKESFEVCNT